MVNPYVTCVKLMVRGPNVARHVLFLWSVKLIFQATGCLFFGTAVVYTGLQRRTTLFVML